ncbi:MAG: hypothetical protein ACR2J9_13110, partial [Gaiellales bacterium]
MHARALAALALILLGAFVAAVPASAATKRPAPGPFFGRAIPEPGTTLRDVELEDGRITAKTISIITADGDGIT